MRLVEATERGFGVVNVPHLGSNGGVVACLMGREQAVAAGVGVDKGVMRQRRAKSESNIGPSGEGGT